MFYIVLWMFKWKNEYGFCKNEDAVDEKRQKMDAELFRSIIFSVVSNSISRKIKWEMWYLSFNLHNAFIVHVESSLANGFSKFNNARLDKESFEIVKNLHLNWYINAMKALMGQLGKQLYSNLLPRKSLNSIYIFLLKSWYCLWITIDLSISFHIS